LLRLLWVPRDDNLRLKSMGLSIIPGTKWTESVRGFVQIS
jgi:hypothetical protein